MVSISNIPFLRLILPFVAGIVAGAFLQATLNTIWLLPLLLAAFIAIGRMKPLTPYRKLLMMALADIFLFICALSLTGITDVSRQSRFIGSVVGKHEKSTLLVYPTELPVKKGKWLKCLLTVNGVVRGDSLVTAKGDVLAYFEAGIDPQILRPGNMLLVNARLSEPPPPMNPHEFDYRRWLANRQVYYTCFLRRGDVYETSLPERIGTLWKFGLYCRNYLLEALRTSGVSPSTFAVCAALLTGQDDDIDRDTIAAFAHSGTLHVLSVSGLHAGLIYLALDFLFRLTGKGKRRKVLRFTFITTGLWLFALVTGFAAPVLRAVIMFNLIGYGAVFMRNTARNQMNLLFVSAFVLLFFRPLFLFDVGFQLSYLAMAGLIGITPRLSGLLKPSAYITDLALQSVCASAAATITTLPLTLFYFKQFPLWFFICNLVVVPATSLLLFVAAGLAAGLSFLAVTADKLVDWLLVFISWFNNPSLGYVDFIDFTVIDLVFCTVLLMITAHAIYARSVQSVRFALLALMIWQIYGIASSLSSKLTNSFTVYQVNKHTGTSVKMHTRVAFRLDDSSRFDFHMKPHFVSMNNPEIAGSVFNYVAARTGGIWIVDNPLVWRLRPPGKVRVLVLCRGVPMPPAPLELMPGLETVVIDGSNDRRSAARAAGICRKFGLVVHNTALQGAFQIELP